MPLLSGPLTADGPVIEVIVGMTAAEARQRRSAGQTAPPSLTLRALIDTGASQTCIDTGSAQALALTSTGSGSFLIPSLGGPLTLHQYEVSLTLLHPQASFTLFTLPVVAAVLAPQGIEVLIGRDMLNRCLYVHDGQAGTWTLGF
jgi:hypothetical protein